MRKTSVGALRKTLRFCARLQQFLGVHATCYGPQIKRWRGFAAFRRADYFLALAQQVDRPAPIASLVRSEFQSARRAGLGALDTSALVAHIGGEAPQ